MGCGQDRGLPIHSYVKALEARIFNLEQLIQRVRGSSPQPLQR